METFIKATVLAKSFNSSILLRFYAPRQSTDMSGAGVTPPPFRHFFVISSFEILLLHYNCRLRILIEKDLRKCWNVSVKFLCVSFIWRSLHFFGKSFSFLFLFLAYNNFYCLFDCRYGEDIQHMCVFCSFPGFKFVCRKRVVFLGWNWKLSIWTYSDALHKEYCRKSANR